jgi:hypothetical protein
MPAFGTITINDGASTPVAHVFSPTKIDGDKAFYANRASGTPAKYEVLTISNRDPLNGSQVNRVEYTLDIPVVADGSDPAVKAGTVIRTLRWQCTELIPSTSTLQERKDGRALFKNLMADTVVTAVSENLEHVY